MKKIFTLTIVCFMMVSWGTAQDRKDNLEPIYMPAQISFIPGFGTAGLHSHKVATNFSLNILGGYVYKVEGLEVGSLVNIIHNDLKGAQASGLINVVGHQVNGGQMAGLSNVVIGSTTGGQVSGMINVTVGNLVGAQIGGLANYADATSGMQLSGMINASIDSVRGGQMAGLANYSGKVEGIQLSGVLNIATKEVKGAQVSGLVNFAPRVKGLQIGLVNIADTVEHGAVIGLFNFVRKGMHKFEVSYDDVVDFNFSYRGGTNRLYSIWSVGIKPQDEAFWTVGAGFGTQWNLRQKIYTNVEATSSWLQLTENEFLEGTYSLNRLNVNFGYRINDYLSVNGGPVLNVYVKNEKNDPTDNALIDIGNKNFYDKQVNDSDVRMWLGYRVAFRF